MTPTFWRSLRQPPLLLPSFCPLDLLRFQPLPLPTKLFFTFHLSSVPMLDTVLAMNGTIEFHRKNGGWIGKTWNGEEWFHWKGWFQSKGEAERFAVSRRHKSLFVE